MSVKRNVEGLRQNAQRKRQQAIEKTEQAIRDLVKDGKPVNFEAVSEVAGVSKAWLYKEVEVKQRIEYLREQRSGKKLVQPKQRASDASKDAIIHTFKERVRRLEEKNRELSRQNEVFAAQVMRVRDLEQQVKRLQAENNGLRQQSLSASQMEVSASSNPEISTELVKLGVQLNTTILQILQDAPLEVLERAVEALREAVMENRVGNPSGFFYRAAMDSWKPNEIVEQKTEQDIFNEWFPLAQQAGLVKASTQIEGIRQVLTVDDTWVTFEQILRQHPIDVLASI